MKPVTIVKRFLNRTTPSIPLPGDIDEESTSPSGTWLLVSQNTESPEPQLTPTTTTIAGQTMAPPHPFYETPRSNMGKNRPRQETDALLPPLFRPRSKLPKLKYGGLQSPNLHCFASSLNINYTADIPQASTLLKATAKSLPSPATFRKAVTSLQSTDNKDASNSERARSSLRDIFYDVGFSSKLFCEIHNSAFIDQRINRIADSLGTGGLLMYMQVAPLGLLVPLSLPPPSRSPFVFGTGLFTCL